MELGLSFHLGGILGPQRGVWGGLWALGPAFLGREKRTGAVLSLSLFWMQGIQWPAAAFSLAGGGKLRSSSGFKSSTFHPRNHLTGPWVGFKLLSLVRSQAPRLWVDTNSGHCVLQPTCSEDLDFSSLELGILLLATAGSNWYSNRILSDVNRN